MLVHRADNPSCLFGWEFGETLYDEVKNLEASLGSITLASFEIHKGAGRYGRTALKNIRKAQALERQADVLEGWASFLSKSLENKTASTRFGVLPQLR